VDLHGAQQGRVVRMVLRQGMMLTVIGAAIGLVLAAAASRLLGSLLFGVSPTDPLVLVGTSAMIVVIAAAASLLPTQRAAKIDPVEAMRAS